MTKAEYVLNGRSARGALYVSGFHFVHGVHFSGTLFHFVALDCFLGAHPGWQAEVYNYWITNVANVFLFFFYFLLLLYYFCQIVVLV